MCLNGRPWGAISAPMKSIPYRGPITDCGSSGEGDKEYFIPTRGVAYNRCYPGLDTGQFRLSRDYYFLLLDSADYYFLFWILLIIIFYYWIVLIIIFVLLDSGNYYFYYWIVAHRGAYSVI